MALEEHAGYQISYGITCSSNGTHSSTCNSMAIQMANSSNTTVNSAWNCAANTQFTSASIFGVFTNENDSFMSTFNSVRNYIVKLIIFACLYGIFIIIHDWTLIAYTKEVNNLSFYPQTTDDFRLTNCCMKLAHCCGLFAAPLILYLLLDVIYMMIIYPFKHFILSKLFKCEETHKINGISYVSAAWVGFSRTMMTFATGVFITTASHGFVTAIPPLDPKLCSCQCNYILNPTDFWILFFVTLIFIINNLIFLKSWVSETVHGQYYLYLIRYKLPIQRADSMNVDDITGTIINQSINLDVDRHHGSGYQLMNNELQADLMAKDSNAYIHCTVQKNNEPSRQGKIRISLVFRAAFVGLASCFYAYAVADALYVVGDTNCYSYSFTLTRTIGIIGFFGSCLVCCIPCVSIVQILDRKYTDA
eukprot:320597_1